MCGTVEVPMRRSVVEMMLCLAMSHHDHADSVLVQRYCRLSDSLPANFDTTVAQLFTHKRTTHRVDRVSDDTVCLALSHCQ